MIILHFGEFMMDRLESATSCFDRSLSAFVDDKGSVRRTEVDHSEVVLLLKQGQKHAISFVTGALLFVTNLRSRRSNLL